MSNDGVNVGWCCFFVVVIFVVGVVGVVGVVVLFVGLWFFSVKVKVVGVLVQVNVGKIDLGQQIIVEWCGKFVFIVYCMKEMLDVLLSFEG